MEPHENEGVCPVCGYDPETPADPSYLPPETFLNERYVVGKMLRFNGEGAEYIGYDTVTSSKVTIREYMPDTLCSRNKDSNIISVKQNCVAQYKAFMSEFVEMNKMLAKMRTLGHINPPLDMFGDNNTGYVIFRYIEGINLAKYLKENAGELTWDEVKRLFPPIFTTLSLVHNAGLVHRGIAPENIIVTDKNELKLIGFCIADARTANTELASEIYQGYAAPEQYSSSNWQGTWTDVYGICALLYRILTGTAPVGAMERMTNDTLMAPRELNGNIPVNVSKVIMSGMDLSGEMRIQTVTELVTQLFEEPEFNKTRPINATQTISIPKQHSTKGPVEPEEEEDTRKPASRHRVFWIALIAAAVGMVVLMAVIMMTLDDTSGDVLSAIPTTTASVSEEPATETSIEIITLENGETVTSQVILEASETEAPQSSATSGANTLPTLAVIQTTAADNSAQTTFKPGATVYIMNDLIGKNFDTIKNTSINDNLTIIPDYIYTDEYDKGTIFEQSIEKGSNYEKGAELTLKISMGPGKALVPEYYGLSKKDYFDILNSAGIKYEEKTYSTEDYMNDYVAWISMEPGEYIDLEGGEVLSVFVADNPNSTQTTTVTTVTTAETTEGSTAWVTTVPPEVVTTTAETTTTTAALTAEPDIIITVDY